MEVTLFGCSMKLSYPLAAALTLVLVLDTTGMCLSCCVAAFCHEMGHLAAMKLQRTSSKVIQFSLFDINIQDAYKGTRSLVGELLVILSGPAVNFILYALAMLCFFKTQVQWLSVFAYNNLALGVFNSLPIFSLDGGNALEQVLERFCSYRTVNIVMNIVSFAVLVPMAAIGFSLLLKSFYNFSLLFTSCYLMCIIIWKQRDN